MCEHYGEKGLDFLFFLSFYFSRTQVKLDRVLGLIVIKCGAGLRSQYGDRHLSCRVRLVLFFHLLFKFTKRKAERWRGQVAVRWSITFFLLAALSSSPINWKWFGFQLPIIISSWCPLSLLYTCLFFSSSAYLAAFSSGHFLGVFQRDDESAQQIFTARFEESSSPCRLIPWWRWSAVADYSLSCCSLGVFQHLSVPFFDVFFHVHLIVVINLTDVLCCSTHARTAKLTLSTRLESG